jgi:hypothetical protein
VGPSGVIPSTRRSSRALARHPERSEGSLRFTSAQGSRIDVSWSDPSHPLGMTITPTRLPTFSPDPNDPSLRRNTGPIQYENHVVTWRRHVPAAGGSDCQPVGGTDERQLAEPLVGIEGVSH